MTDVAVLAVLFAVTVGLFGYGVWLLFDDGGRR